MQERPISKTHLSKETNKAITLPLFLYLEAPFFLSFRNEWVEVRTPKKSGELENDKDGDSDAIKFR